MYNRRTANKLHYYQCSRSKLLHFMHHNTIVLVTDAIMTFHTILRRADHPARPIMSFNTFIGIGLTRHVADKSAVAAINRALRGAASACNTPVISLICIIGPYSAVLVTCSRFSLLSTRLSPECSCCNSRSCMKISCATRPSNDSSAEIPSACRTVGTRS